MKRGENKAKVPCKGRVGDSKLREKEEPWARRGTATFLQNGKEWAVGGGYIECSYIFWMEREVEFMTSGHCSLCEVEPRA